MTKKEKAIKITNIISTSLAIPATLCTILYFVILIVGLNNKDFYNYMNNLTIDPKALLIVLAVIFSLGVLGIIVSSFTSGTLKKILKITFSAGILAFLFRWPLLIPGLAGQLLYYLFILLVELLVIVVAILVPFIPVGISILINNKERRMNEVVYVSDDYQYSSYIE